MSRIVSSPRIDLVANDELPKFLSIFLQDVISTVNNGLDFNTNFNSKILNVIFPSIGTDVTVTHGLRRIAEGYLIFSLSENMVIYNGLTPWNGDQIFLRSSAIGTAKIMVF